MWARLQERFKSHISNIPGWRTRRKIVVLESDDWGTIRMPSINVIKKLKNYGLPVEKCHYMMNDALASETDFERLFNVLSGIKNGAGNFPVITANTIVGNPDFEKIRASDFESYSYELFVDTLQRYPEHQNSFDYWNKGMNEGFFHPQFHGREHVNVCRWLNDLRQGDPELLFAFQNKLFGISTTVTGANRKSYLAAYDSESLDEKRFVHSLIEDGLKQFRELFGYKSLSTIAPNYIWDDDVENVLSKGGVKYLQGGRVQRFPKVSNNGTTHARRFQGQKNGYNQRYLIRNCKFEPSSDHNIDWVGKCMWDVKTAFLWNKPAIIDTHRVNYIGYINKMNRERSLRLLKELLSEIVKQWPEAEFMTSDKLGELMNE